MQIKVDFPELLVMSPHQDFGGAADMKSQGLFINLLTQDKSLDLKPLDGQQNSLVQISSNADQIPMTQDTLIRGAEQAGLTVGNQQERLSSERPDIKLMHATHEGQIFNAARAPLQQLSGLQQYESNVLIQQHADDHRVCQYSLWQLIATGNQSYEGLAVIQTDRPVLTLQTVTQGSINGSQRPRPQTEHSLWIQPSAQTGAAEVHWCWGGAEFEQSTDNSASTNEIAETVTVSVPDEFMQMLQKENLLVLPDEANKERLYYRNFVSHNPERELRQMWQLVDVASSRVIDFYINGRYSGTGAPYAG